MQTILVEHPYVDRHWLDEYAGYYATLLEPPHPKATRLHFFSAGWTLDDVWRFVREMVDGTSRELQDKYVGFCVVRPLPGAPIGRTVLRPYSGVGERCFAPAALKHRVHLAGATIKIHGLPFQQQDQGVAACATTALWSALTKVMRTDGGRAPTPYAVTVAATQRRVQARAFPAVAGLDLDQMASAIHAFGYQPHVFESAGEPSVFFLALKVYLRSGIPVIVRARTSKGVLHALTLVGYRERPADSVVTVADLEITPKLGSREVLRWYAHDDRLGPYARLRFVSADQLELMPTAAGFEELAGPLVFTDAVVPLYPKLRLTAEELVEFGVDLSPTIRLLSGDQCPHIEPRFMLGGDYLHALHKRPIADDRRRALCTTMAMSRYVGVIEWFSQGEWVLDSVYDTTDLRRGDASRPPLLALVPRNQDWIDRLETYRDLRFGPGPVIA